MQRRILVVEDDIDLRRALSIRLKAAGYAATTAADGASALASVRESTPDLVILDLGLPAGDGYEVMDRLRRMGHLTGVPIVVMSARDPATEEGRALAAGAVAYLPKPHDPARLLRVIAQHLWEPTPRSESAPKILLVEDDPDTRAGLSIRLESQGFEVAEAVDGASAMGVALREHPALILLDLGLPAGDGFVLLQRFRSHGALSAVPVIVLSARDAATHRQKALDAGALAYFQKPVDGPALTEAIRQALHTR